MVFPDCFRQESKNYELIQPEEIKTMVVPSYGSLLARNKSLQKELIKIELRNYHLHEETRVQSKVIYQLKKLLENQTKSPCSYGHRLCKIKHEKYNYVKINKPVAKYSPTKYKKTMVDEKK